LSPGEAEVTLTINPTTESQGGRYDFSNVAGKLAWRGDAVAEQRGMRDEW
jgi:hypothetical protein